MLTWAVFMIISELPVLQSYFDNHWPMFGQESSFYSLGGIMMILGVATLGNLNTKAMTPGNHWHDFLADYHLRRCPGHDS